MLRSGSRTKEFGLVVEKHVRDAHMALKALQVLMRCKFPGAVFFGGVRKGKTVQICTAKSKDFSEVFPIIPQYDDTAIFVEWEGGVCELLEFTEGEWKWAFEKLEG